MVTTLKIGKWHYNCVLKGNLDDCFAGPSRCGVDAQSIVDGLLGRFGAGGLAHVQCRAVGASEGGGDALLAFQDPAKRGPARCLAALVRVRRVRHRALSRLANIGEIRGRFRRRFRDPTSGGELRMCPHIRPIEELATTRRREKRHGERQSTAVEPAAA